LVIAACVVAALAGCVPADPGGVTTGRILPEFSLVNWDGRRITRETLRDKRTVLAFTYAKCELACPILTSQLTSLDGSIESPPDVVYLHVSVNPADDTSEEIHRHFTAHGIDPEKDTRWLFARGEEADIHRLLERFGVKVEKKRVADTFLIEHTIQVWVVGRDGRLVRMFDSYLWDVDEMKHALGS
jgi:protein SCO1/2